MTMQDGQQHGQPVLVEANGDPARIAKGIIHQRLHLDQQGPCPFAADHDNGTGNRLFITG